MVGGENTGLPGEGTRRTYIAGNALLAGEGVGRFQLRNFGGVDVERHLASSPPRKAAR